MADAKISALTALASGHATGDLIPLVDVSDTTQAASGTTKHTTLANLLANLPGPTDAVGISHTGQSLTGSNAQSLVNLATTWNTTGTPTAFLMTVTDTASNASSLLMDLKVGATTRFKIQKNGYITFSQGIGAAQVSLFESNSTAVCLSSTSSVAWGSGAPTINVLDTSITRSAAGVLGIRGNSTTAGGALEFIEQTAPAAPSADRVRLYAQDNGAGKTQLMALFNTGAAQQVAIEP